MRRCSAAVCVGFTLALFLAFVIFILVPETERGKDHDDGYFYDLDNDKQIVCLVLVIITSSLSIMGSCLIFISYLGLRSRGDTLSNATFDKTSNAAPTEVVLLLSVSLADFISAFTKLTTSSSSVHDRDWLIQKTKFCAVMGFAEQFGTLATALWTLCIAIYLYRIIILKRGSEGWLLGFQMLAWGLPFLTATIALFLGFNGSSGMWCWILPKWAQWSFFYIIVCFVFVAIAVIYVRIFYHVRNNSFGTMSDKMRRRQRTTYMRLMFFPLAFLLTWAGSLVWRLDELVRRSGASKEHYELFVYTSLSLPSQGWLNAIAWYWFNKSKINHMYGEVIANIRSYMFCHATSNKGDAAVPLMDNGESKIVAIESGADGTDVSDDELRFRLNTEEYEESEPSLGESDMSSYLPPAFQAAIQFQTGDLG